jgi:integrase
MYLYRRTGSTGTKSKYWSVKYRGPDGRYVIKTTRRQSKEEARSVGGAWERAAELARAGEFTQSAAATLFNEILAVTGQSFNAPRISSYFTQWIEGKKVLEKAPATIDRYEAVIHAFKNSLPERRQDGLLSSLTALDIEHFRNTEKASGKGTTTVNFGLKVMRAVLGDARRKGLLSINVAEAVELLPMHSEERLPFDDEEIRRLLKAADNEWRGMILFGYHCGLRLTDASDLSWDNVDLLNRTLIFRAKKTSRRGKDTTIALHCDLIEYLDRLPVTDRVGAPLFPSLHQRSSGSHAGLSNEFARLMTRAGLKTALGEAKSGKGRRFRSQSFHSLRHSFISRLANAEVGPDVRKELTGHSSSSDEIHRRYTHLDLSLQRKAIDQLPSITH